MTYPMNIHLRVENNIPIPPVARLSPNECEPQV